MTIWDKNKPGWLGTIFRSFWSVFTLPFRTVLFGFKKLFEIPIRDLILMAVFFIVLVSVTLLFFVEATSQPGFCVTCHYMKPYFASWQASSHKGVHCTLCHFPPGVKGTVVGKFTAISMVVNYITGVYKKSKPWAEISDEACLRPGCHETRLLEGKVTFKEDIIFDHTPHLLKDRRGKHLRCTSCHSQIVQGSHMTVTEETCFLCHFKDQLQGSPMTTCTFCHEAPVANNINSLTSKEKPISFDHTEIVLRKADCHLCHGQMAIGNGDVPKERCSYCHAEGGKIDQYSQTALIHQIHITDHKVECNHCHNSILHRSLARTGDIKPDCQGCHIDRHVAQYDLFSGQGAKGVESLPSTMFKAGLVCRACHILLPGDWHDHPDLATRVAGAASCEPCHDKTYFTLYQQAKPILIRRLNETVQRLESLKNSGRNAKKDSVLTICNDNLDLLKRGKPIHNLEYADRILDNVNRTLDILHGKVVVSRLLPDTTSTRCVRCHYGQDEANVPYHTVKTFPHGTHVHGSNLGCTYCHLEQPKHGELKEINCEECHHKTAAVSCEPCHIEQRNLFNAKGIYIDYSPDPMAVAGMTCRDCHEVTGTMVSRPTEATCQTCHEPGYWNYLIEFQKDFDQTIQQLKTNLDKLPNRNEQDKYLSIITELEAEGSLGSHNPTAVESLIDSLLSIQQ